MDPAARPTGLCIVNDRAAQAFIVGAEELGLRVPEDVSVVGQDDLPPARFGRVPLTTVTHPVAAIADLMLALLRQRLAGYDGPPRREVVRGELVARSSTARPPSPPPLC
jgi:DNA-binding LacI/PurR family transcriptional regulator